MELNLTQYALGSANIAAFTVKPQAIAFAKAHGWSPKNVKRAFNRFSLFWIVSDYQGAGFYRILKRDGQWLDIPAEQATAKLELVISNRKAWIQGGEQE